jgi:DNA-binding Lrp family transcriptional regulator
MLIGYRYMLREISKSLAEDNITVGELSRRLNRSPEELKQLLEVMVKRGDLKGSCMDLPSRSASKCVGCAMGQACPGTNLGIGKVYHLTIQGKRECNA